MNKNNQITSLGIFCGSSSGNLPIYAQSAEQLAQVMADNKIELIYGGAHVGLMGVIANKMLALGSKVIGVIPQSLVDVEVAHEGISELRIVTSMNERKEVIAELSDGFIMLPGGSGSLDEFFEMHTLAQLSYHQKPCAILNVAGYYDHLLQFLDHAIDQGFIKAIHREMILVEDCPDTLIKKMNNYQAPVVKKWLNVKSD